MRVYAHRTSREAEAEVAFIFDRLSGKNPADTLDIACGPGRHLVALSARSRAFGLDLSAPLLEHAARLAGRTRARINLVRGDMRALPFFSSSFDLLTSFFTSFGYFKTDDEHLNLLREWRRVSRPGAVLVLDYLNKERLTRELQPETREETEDEIIVQQRAISGGQRRVNKKILIENKKTGGVSVFHESVMLYSSADLARLLSRAGFSLDRVFGDFDGSALNEDSPRLIAFAQAQTEAAA